jgi:hypothetical protein
MGTKQGDVLRRLSTEEEERNPQLGSILDVLYYNAATIETFDLTTMAFFGLLMPPCNPIGSGGFPKEKPTPSCYLL